MTSLATTLRRMFIYPKDKVGPDEQGELAYQIPCKTRLEEHSKDAENAPREHYTRSGKKRPQSTIDTRFKKMPMYFPHTFMNYILLRLDSVIFS